MKHRNTPPGFYRQELVSTGRTVFTIRSDSLDIRTVHMDTNDDLGSLVTFENQFECVRKHLKRNGRFYWKVDLASAFDSVTPHSFAGWWDLPVYIRCCPAIFFHKDGGLIQGAPASPRIFQLYCQKSLDPAINSFCARNRVVFSRFADDLLFSSNEPLGKEFRRKIRGIIKQADFRINEHKVILADTSKEPITYLGMVIFKGHVSVTEEFDQKLKDSQPGSSRNGMVAWKKTVLALNRRKR